MTKAPKKPLGRPRKEKEPMQQTALRLFAHQIEGADAVVEKRRGNVDRSQVLREAIDIGLETLLKRA